MPRFSLRILTSLSILFFLPNMSADEEFFDPNKSDANTDGLGAEESDVDASDQEHLRSLLHVPPPDADIGIVRQVSNVYSCYNEPATNNRSPANRPF